MLETSFSSNLTFTREEPRKFRGDKRTKKVDNSYLKVNPNQNILINSFETGFFALSKKGETVTVNELRRRLERSVSKYQNAGEIPFDFDIDIEAKIIRQTFNEFMFEIWKNRGSVHVSRYQKGTVLEGVSVGGRFIKFRKENT